MGAVQDLPFPTPKENLPIEEGIFQIDNDKLAYVQLIVDDFSNYNENEPYGTWKLDGLLQKIDERRETLANWLTVGKSPICHKVLLITVLGTIGRFISFFLKHNLMILEP